MRIPDWIRHFRWNWGWAILLVFITFVVVFLYVFYLSVVELRTNEMSVEDYYTEELQYGKVLDMKHRADTMKTPVEIRLNERALEVRFPAYIPPKRVEGTLVLYRPNKKLFDRHIPLALDTAGRLMVPRDSLLPGRWDAKMKWRMDTVSYYVEKKLWVE